MEPPQTNARLIQINGSGATEDDFGESAGDGTLKWKGNSGAYVTETVRTSFSQGAGALVKSKDDRIRIDDSLRAPDGTTPDIHTGDVVTFTWRGKTHIRKVLDLSAPKHPLVPSYVTLHLEESGTESG